MRYFKLTDEMGIKTEYIKVINSAEEIKTKSDSIVMTEITEEEYRQIEQPGGSKLDMYMPIKSH